MAFVFEMNSNAVLVSRPKVFAQPVVQLPGPLALQKCDDLRAAVEKLITVSPFAVFGVAQRHFLRIARVPQILRHLHLARCTLHIEGWDQRLLCHTCSSFRIDADERCACGCEGLSILKGMRTLDRSRQLQQRAERLFPGGVDSPVRAFRAVGGDPPFVVRAEGAYLWDVDGNRYIDYFGSWGPMILGHAFPPVVEAIQQAAARSASFGASTPSEADLAELIVQAVPSIEKLRFVSSGTEATMSAIRLARAFTKRNYVIKFEGCYHGHSDGLLVKAGSGVATFGIPGSAGVLKEIVHFTLALPFNDISAVEAAFAAHRGQIACIILEPIVGNMGCVPPENGYLQALREITRQENSLLIFDEVMTGFRVAYGGAQELYQVQPDITTLGKIIGGGLPCGAFGARAEI